MLPNKKPLKFGLNVKAKVSLTNNNSKKNIRNIFGAEADEDEGSAAGGVEAVNRDIRVQAGDLNQKRKVFEQLKETLDEDPSAFDYDEVYDQMKHNQKVVSEEIKGTKIEKPKYIENLTKAAELRKRDRLRAEEKMLQKEREREGEQYADKEKFVTEAYKKQQEELKRLEELDNKTDSRNSLGSLSGFYRNMLDSRSKIHEAGIIVNAKQSTVQPSAARAPQVSEEDIVTQTIASGKAVELNDDNEVIDKRQLLSAGLNVTRKRKTAPEVDEAAPLSAYDEFVQRRAKEQAAKKLQQAEAQGRRLAAQLQAQIAEKETKEKQEVDEKLQELTKTMARRNDSDSVQDARARYLARKKAASGAV